MSERQFKYGIEPKKPASGNWEMVNLPQSAMPEDDGYAFVSPLKIFVRSSVHFIDGRLEFHISISDCGQRIASSMVPPILAMFGAKDWDEDNHVHGGIARHFWCPVGKPAEVCPCKNNEKPTVESDYVTRDE